MKLLGPALSTCLTGHVFAAPVLAEGTTGVFFECDVTSKPRFETWAAGKLGIVVRKNGTVVVTDARTLGYGEGAVEAAVLQNSARTLKLRWAMDGGLRDDGYLLPAVSYEVQLDRATDQLSLEGALKGPPKVRFRNQGTCKVRTG